MSLYYAALAVSVFSYLLLRYVTRTPFGLALQGIRDDPVRMSALGYNLVIHRALAFVLGGFVASLAGVLNVWWNRQIDPASIGIGEILALLIIAVIGGMNRLEGAWVGAFIYVVVNNYVPIGPAGGQDRDHRGSFQHPRGCDLPGDRAGFAQRPHGPGRRRRETAQAGLPTSLRARRPRG